MGGEELSSSAVEHEEVGAPEFIAFGLLLLAMSFGIVTRTTLSKWIPIPYTVLLLIWGGVVGLFYREFGSPFNPALNNDIEVWLVMDPRVLQVIFLPILIFAGSFNAQLHIFERRLGQMMFLAGPGVIVGAVLTAAFMKFILPYDWSWNLALVFGSIVSATDPVAVVALLEELGVSEKLGTLIEGESLLNDGSAIVVFLGFLEAVEGTHRNWYQIVGFGSRLALGGPAIGALIGIFGAFILGYVINDALVEVSITVVLAFATFAICEDTDVKVSGVLAVVTLGLVLAYYGKPRVSSSVLPSLVDVWKTLQFFADTTIFFVAGLIVVGAAISRDRVIYATDWGYLLALFVALYIIRALVVLISYPILRSGEYKITNAQMIVLTHAGLRGAVALILALVVDGVSVIEDEARDKIVFHTAGVAVLSLLFNATTAGPLVRFLKLDRPTEASESVLGNACFALEMSMEAQQKSLQEHPFLGDANWPLVWRYVPVFTAQTYWHRICKGHIVLSQAEVADVKEANATASDHLDEIARAAGQARAGKSSRRLTYRSLPHRLRSPWHRHSTTFKFEDAGGRSTWGDLDQLLTNHTAQDGHDEAWTGHLKHSRSYTRLDMESAYGEREGNEEAKHDGAGGESVAGINIDDESNSASRWGSSPGGNHQGKMSRSASRLIFQQAVSVVDAAGVPVSLHGKEGVGEEADTEALLEARLRFLTALKAEYSKARRGGRLGSGGLRVLTEAINSARDRVEKGEVLDSWSEMSGHFRSGLVIKMANYLNWWPARPIAAAAIARRLSFQLEMAWNFQEGHHEAIMKSQSLYSNNGTVSKVQRAINAEAQAQIDSVENQVSTLTMQAPLVTRGVKTRTAARVMIERYKEAVEHLAENGHLEEKEEEKIMNGVTDAEMRIAYHPNLEALPPLSEVLEKIHFLRNFTDQERQRVMDAGAASYQDYVGQVRLLQIGKRGARRGKGKNKDFNGWFYVVRGSVEKETTAEDGTIDSCTKTSGALFGMADSMLNLPHHAGYLTQSFCNVVVFDRDELLKLCAEMPALNKSLWVSVAAHTLRRSTRFHKFRLANCHGLLGRAEFLCGSGVGKQTVDLGTRESLVLVRGSITSMQGKIEVTALGHPDTRVAPVLLENEDDGTGTVTLSIDYKVLKLSANTIQDFSRDEYGRMNRQEAIRRRSASMSSLSAKGLGDQVRGPAAGGLVMSIEDGYA